MTLADGRALAYAEAGPADGLPLLVCHGLPGCRLLPPFGSAAAHRLGIRILAVDRPGIGRSDFQHDRRVADWSADASELAEILGLDRFSVLGISAGGPYALACCAEMPDRIVRAGVVSGVEHGLLREALVPALYRLVAPSPLLSRAIYGLLVLGVERDRDRALRGLRRALGPADRRVLARPEISEFILDSMLEAAFEGARGLAFDERAVSRPWGFEPAEIPADVDLTFWYGAEDRAARSLHDEGLPAEISHASVRVYPGEGHLSVFFNRYEEILTELAA